MKKLAWVGVVILTIGVAYFVYTSSWAKIEQPTDLIYEESHPSNDDTKPKASPADNVSENSTDEKYAGITAEWINHSYSEKQTKDLQDQVDAGHRPGQMDPVQVGYEFLKNEFGIEGKDVTRSEKHTIENEVRIIYSRQNGELIELKLIQPIRKDRTGIWIVQQFRRQPATK